MRQISFLTVLIFAAFLSARAEDWRTEYEMSGFIETSRYDETIAFCKRLDEASPAIRYHSFGTSAEGRELPILEVQTVNTPNQPLLFIVAGIHAGEIDGKDAGLTLLRDAVIFNKYPGLLDGIRIAFVPILNVDGHERFSAYSRPNQIGPKEMGWRTTAQNLNLNRDWMKADSPEMRAMLKEIARLNPDFLVDIHVSDGADYQYVITYGLETHDNALEPLRRYCQDVFLPDIRQRMQTAGYDFVPYILLRKGYDIQGGWTNESYEPRFSTGYGAIINLICPPFLYQGESHTSLLSA
jgi:murein tripeptide amidase MpaA